jgi:hypothetical protein
MRAWTSGPASGDLDAGFCQFLTGTYLFLGLTIFGTFTP